MNIDSDSDYKRGISGEQFDEETEVEAFLKFTFTFKLEL